MIKLSIDQFKNNILTSSHLVEDLPLATGVARIRNTDGFTDGCFVVVGDIGLESSEVRRVSVVDITTGNLTLIENVRSSHWTKEFVYVVKYDKVRIYKSSGIDSGYILTTEYNLDPSNKTLDVILKDESNVWFKYTLYNSITADETDINLSSPIGVEQPEMIKTLRMLVRDFSEDYKYDDQVLKNAIDVAVQELNARNILNIKSVDAGMSPQPTEPQKYLIALVAAEILEPSYIDFSFRDGDKSWSQSLNELGNTRKSLIDDLIQEYTEDPVGFARNIVFVQENTKLTRDFMYDANISPRINYARAI